jgi:hypothetical protein
MVYPALLPLMRTPRLPVVDWTDDPADLNRLVSFAERQNLVSARVASHFNWPLPVVTQKWTADFDERVYLWFLWRCCQQLRMYDVERMHVIGQWITKVCGRNWTWSNLRHPRRIYFEELRDVTNCLICYSRSLDREPNAKLPENEAPHSIWSGLFL